MKQLTRMLKKLELNKLIKMELVPKELQHPQLLPMIREEKQRLLIYLKEKKVKKKSRNQNLIHIWLKMR